MKKINILLAAIYFNPLVINMIISLLNYFHLDYRYLTISQRMRHGIFFLVIFIINVVSLISDNDKNNIKSLYEKMMRVKIGLIPFCVIFFISHLHSHADYYWYLELGLFLFFSYIVLISSSAFPIMFLNNLYKNNVIGVKEFKFLSILQLFFITDMISLVIIYKKWGKIELKMPPCQLSEKPLQ